MTRNTSNKICVTDFNNKPVNLIDKYNHKPVLLLLYNNNCLGCTGRAIPLAYKFKQQYTHVEVLGIHCNFSNTKTTKAAITRIFTNTKLPFPIYLDENHSVYDFFKSEGTPQWILLNNKGMVYRSIFGSQANSENRLHYALESLI